jgi:hypothetical protein
LTCYHKDDSTGKVGWVGYKQLSQGTALLPATYESIYESTLSYPTFFGKKAGKYAVIYLNRNEQFYETPAQFDDVKKWTAINNVVCTGTRWQLLKGFGVSDGKNVKTEIDLETLAENVDDILRTNDPVYYFYPERQTTGRHLQQRTHGAICGNKD